MKKRLNSIPQSTHPRHPIAANPLKTLEWALANLSHGGALSPPQRPQPQSQGVTIGKLGVRGSISATRAA